LQKISKLEEDAASLRALLTSNQEVATTTCHVGDNFSWNYCKSDCKCEIGQGDCDGSQHCLSGYCAYDVGKKYGKDKTLDVCENPPAKQVSPAQAKTSVMLSPVVFDENNLIAIKGKAIDIDTQEPIEGAVLYLGQQELSKTGRGGIFEIKLDKRFSLSKDIRIGSSQHMKSGFLVCANCKGYDLAVVVSPIEGADVVFPVFASKIEIGNIKLKKASDVQIFSDRFIKAESYYEKSPDNFIQTSFLDIYSQTGNLFEALPYDYTAKIIFYDKQGNKYEAKAPQTSEQMALSFMEGELSFNVCSSGVCEQSREKGIALSFPNKKIEFEPAKVYDIEWLQTGLENESLDFELLAYSNKGELVNGFQHVIATSVPANLGILSWQAPVNLDKGTKYKIVVYNKMCSESGETLVTCLKERYLDKSEDFFVFKQNEPSPSFAQTQLANIAQTAALLLAKIQQLLGK